MSAPALRLALSLCSPADTFPANLRDILEAHPGGTPVEAQASAPEWGPFDLRFGDRFGVRVTPLLLVALDTLEGVEVLEYPPLEAPTPSEVVAAPAPALEVAPAQNAPQRRFPKVPAEVEAFASAMRTKPGMVLEAVHEYTHPDGSPWWWVARWKDRTTGEKMPRPFRRTPAGDFVGTMPDIPTGRPLYRGHRLSQNPSDLVYLVEGEVCADCLESVGLLAVTWPNGAQSVGKVDWSPLAGRDVVLWPDNDAPGLEAMRSIRGPLERLGALVLVVDVVALAMPPKGDVVDWLRRFLEQHGARRVSDLPGGRDLVAEALAVLPILDGMEAVA